MVCEGEVKALFWFGFLLCVVGCGKKKAIVGTFSVTVTDGINYSTYRLTSLVPDPG